MGRKRNPVYEERALEVMTELGGAPIRKKDLVEQVFERYPEMRENKWNYNYIIKAVTESEAFDTSTRGYVALATGIESAPVETSEPSVSTEPDYSEIGEHVGVKSF